MNEVPNFVVFDTRTRQAIASGDSHKELLSQFHGKTHKIAQTVPVGYRIEW